MGARSAISNSDAIDTVIDDLALSTQSRLGNQLIPPLILKQERFDFVPPLRFSKNFTDCSDDSTFEMPFVSSKRPEEIKKSMK